MPIVDQDDDKVIRLVRKEAEKYHATVKKINLSQQILDIECPDHNKEDCAVAIQKILDKHYHGR